ncbi:peptide-N(4)-(N-acetyl-beta-glucosaminyl)asparagine amidase [Oncorhynchus tshawytscha]|uniref:Peptide-N(4)-(N-acetyl-beta-glucosaminyl)asparagine amidase n=1 Tax=Oncorhynchus tshawytscha TaxID=74940 RepID=A0A8C8JCM8_ONCTS|nr:peptide-N(4)-(N-acetyl-beta-glucosaminyl)asparagine amidase [Oncorhynchus tshawytscha]
MAGSQGFSTLCENSNEVFLDVAKLLITYADNILRNPNEGKYRSIRIGNPTFSTKLLPIRGAVECLFEMGFEEAETHLVFPKSASVDQLRRIRESIAAERDQRLGVGQPQQSPVTASATALASAPASAAAQGPPVIASLAARQTPAQAPSLESSMIFLTTLQSNFQHVMEYENSELQQKALGVIPHQQLTTTAKEKLQQAKQADPDCNLSEEDLLVLELLRWFKGDFFSWVDCLPCNHCGGPTQSSGPLAPSTEDLRWGAQRVENHHCQACNHSTRFPRYNNPEKLLETRRGRCGEWANCFTLCCRALDLEARYIWDSTDHVWTEVYSASQHRWLHCDSCENACDKPLLYEIGWGKKLDYVLAFSKDQVVDVTWRYSCYHPEVLSRRNKVQEPWLLYTINGLNAVRQQSLSSERKKELLERLLVELVEFISPKTPKQGELGGRNSGSLAWRNARGETGPGTTPSAAAAEFVFVPTEKEKSGRVFHLRYNSTKDHYCRVSNDSEDIQGWDKTVWRKESVFRKLENDWQMVYLARTEGSSSGKISWKLDCAPVRMKIKTVSVRACSQTFHSGTVRWGLQSGQNTTEFSGDGEMHLLPGLSGSSELVLEAELAGGEGESSWQHSQLFRRSLNEPEESSLEILVEMEEDA